MIIIIIVIMLIIAINENNDNNSAGRPSAGLASQPDGQETGARLGCGRGTRVCKICVWFNIFTNETMCCEYARRQKIKLF